jgi:transposase
MGVLVRVVRGNQDAAARYFFRVLASGAGKRRPGRGRPVYDRPGEVRRKARMAGEHKREQVALYEQLGVIFSRRARGF